MEVIIFLVVTFYIGKFLYKNSQKTSRKSYLNRKYGNEIGYKLFTKNLDIGMSKEMVIASLGNPQHIGKITKTKNSEKVTYYYGSYKTKMNTIKYRTEITLKNNLIEKIVQ